MISDKDRILIDRMITLKYLHEQLEENKEIIPTLPFKIPEAHENVIQHLIDLTHKDIVVLNRLFRQENIKIISVLPDHDGEFTQYNYVCKKYHGYSRYWSYALDMKASHILEGYLKLTRKA